MEKEAAQKASLQAMSQAILESIKPAADTTQQASSRIKELEEELADARQAIVAKKAQISNLQAELGKMSARWYTKILSCKA